jgi:hypothetical protein
MKTNMTFLCSFVAVDIRRGTCINYVNENEPTESDYDSGLFVKDVWR